MTDPVRPSGTGPSRTVLRSSRSRLSIQALIMNLTVYPLLILQTLFFILLAPLVLPLAKFLAGRDVGRIVRYFIWVYGRIWMIIMSPFVRFETYGLSADRFPVPCIIVVNHLSFFDIFCMGALPFSNGAFTVRKWPFRMFWYAPFMRLAGYVDMESFGVDRAMRRCSALLSQGVSLMFFPEGHRSRDGELGRFYSGAFKLAVQTDTPLVPVCISGTDQLLPPGRFFMAPATVRMQALGSIEPSGFSGESDHVALRKQVKERIDQALADMRRCSQESNK